MVGLSEEEQNSMQIPSHMRCDACHAIAHKLTTNIREDGTQTRERQKCPETSQSGSIRAKFRGHV